MSPRKLSDADKQEILKQYRNSEETTSTLASRYGVNSSTISRFLKNRLSDSEYESLIQQKRLSRTPNRGEKPILKTAQQSDSSESNSSGDKPILRRRRRSSAPPETTIATPILEEKTPALAEEKVSLKDEVELFEEEEDEEDLEDSDEEEWKDEIEEDYRQIKPKNADVKVLPLSEASLPKICYLVIDRAADLITRPLKDFADLGRIPAEEVQQKTLPVFETQRVARRFSNRRGRVIKVPDGLLLQKTCDYLQAKGITRLLIDGQVYSLSSS